MLGCCPDRGANREAAGLGHRQHGELLRMAEEAGFEVLLTTDKNIAYQQNLTGRNIAIVVLGRNRWSLVRRAAGRVAEAVGAAEPGGYVVVNVPED